MRRCIGFTWKTLASGIKTLFILHGVGDEPDPICSGDSTVAKHLKTSTFERKGLLWLVK